MVVIEPCVIVLDDDDDSDDVQIISSSVCKPASTTRGLDYEVAREPSTELSPPSPTHQAHKVSWANSQNSSDSAMEPITEVEAKEAAGPDGSGDVAGVQPSGVPKLQITPATAESTPDPPDPVDESLLVPPQLSTRTNCNGLSDAGESSLEMITIPSDEPPSATMPGDDDSPPSLSSKSNRVRNDRKSPFTAKFFGDMLNTIDRIFPYQKFADEHDCTIGDVHRALMATVFTPLTDANERGKPRIAERGRSMMKKWNQRYKEMVQKLNQESNERQMPMEFEQVLIAASQNLDAYWESRNSGFEAYKAFQNVKKKQVLEDRAGMLKRAAERDAKLTHEAAEARRKRTKLGIGAAAEGESSRRPTNNYDNIEHIDLTDPTPTPQPNPFPSKPHKPSTKRHPVLVDAFGNYQDMPEAASDYFDQQYRDMAAGSYVRDSNGFGDMDAFDEFDDDEDGDYEDEGKKKGKGKRKGGDEIGEMLAILRRSPRRLEGISGKKGKGKGKEVEKCDGDGEEKDDAGGAGLD